MAMFIVVNAMVGRYIPIAATYPKSYTPVDNLFLWCNLYTFSLD